MEPWNGETFSVCPSVRRSSRYRKIKKTSQNEARKKSSQAVAQLLRRSCRVTAIMFVKQFLFTPRDFCCCARKADVIREEPTRKSAFAFTNSANLSSLASNTFVITSKPYLSITCNHSITSQSLLCHFSVYAQKNTIIIT